MILLSAVRPSIANVFQMERKVSRQPSFVTNRDRSDFEESPVETDFEQHHLEKKWKEELVSKETDDQTDSEDENDIHSSLDQATRNASYTDLDVLSGRGGGTNLHPGNRFYRDLILTSRTTYNDASKTMKPELARQIVLQIKERGGRFLRKDSDGSYREISDTEAKAKTSQALRHRTFELRNTKDPDRVKMNGRWRSNGNESTKTTSNSPDSSGAGRIDRDSPIGSVRMVVSNVQNGPADVPSVAAGTLLGSSVSSLGTDRSFLEESIRRQRHIEAAMSASSSSPNVYGDSAYMAAIANLKHREAMLRLDRAIHEAETRKYTSFVSIAGYPNHLPPSILSTLTGISSLPSTLAPFHTSSFPGIGSISRDIRERAILHSQLGAGRSPLSGDVLGHVDLRSGFLPVHDMSLSSTSLTSKSREKLTEMEHLIKSHSESRGSDANQQDIPKSPGR